MSLGPKYPNQQLRAVSLEAYFNGRLGAPAAFGQIQAAVSDRLPHLFVPNIGAGEAVDLRPFQLRDDQQRRSLALAINQVTYISFQYPGHNAFVDEALPTMRMALDKLGVERLNRVVFRYENEVGIRREPDGALPLRRVFPNALPAVLGDGKCHAVNAMYEVRWEHDDVRGVRGLHARVEQEGAAEVMRVAVFASVEAVPVDHLPVAIEKAHGQAYGLFEALISNEFRDFIQAGKE